MTKLGIDIPFYEYAKGEDRKAKFALVKLIVYPNRSHKTWFRAAKLLKGEEYTEENISEYAIELAEDIKSQIRRGKKELDA